MKRILDVLLFFLLPREAYLRRIGLNFGVNCRWIHINRNTFGSEPYLVSIGDHVTVASGVKFITHDGGVWVLRDTYPRIDVFKPIVIGNNVFIGLNSIVLPGTEIGDNTVIGAGSVVRGKLEGNAVYAGVPAKKIRSLEEYEKSSLAVATETKGLSPRQKRQLLSRRFAPQSKAKRLP